MLNTRYFTIESAGKKANERHIDLQKVLLFFLIYTKLGKKDKIEIIVELSILLSGESIQGRQSFYNNKKETNAFEID